MTDALDVIRKQRASLSPASRKIADAILEDPEAALEETITVIAERAGASGPSVARFCRALGYPNLAAFRVALASAVAGGQAPPAPPPERFAHHDVRPGDAADAYAKAVLLAGAQALERAAADLDANAVERAVALLDRAQRMFFFGVGGSGAVAADAQHKFVRLEAAASAPGDAHLMTMAAAGARPGDVIVAISNSGRSVDVIDAVDLAKKTGAAVIALAPERSPLAERADALLAVEPVEDVDLHVATGTRLAHLALIDALATGVALRRGAAYRERMAAIKKALERRRV